VKREKNTLELEAAQLYANQQVPGCFPASIILIPGIIIEISTYILQETGQ
jgi:hypothetical protein